MLAGQCSQVLPPGPRAPAHLLPGQHVQPLAHLGEGALAQLPAADEVVAHALVVLEVRSRSRDTPLTQAGRKLPSQAAAGLAASSAPPSPPGAAGSPRSPSPAAAGIAPARLPRSQPLLLRLPGLPRLLLPPPWTRPRPARVSALTPPAPPCERGAQTIAGDGGDRGPAPEKFVLGGSVAQIVSAVPSGALLGCWSEQLLVREERGRVAGSPKPRRRRPLARRVVSGAPRGRSRRREARGGLQAPSGRQQKKASFSLNLQKFNPLAGGGDRRELHSAAEALSNPS